MGIIENAIDEAAKARTMATLLHLDQQISLLKSEAICYRLTIEDLKDQIAHLMNLNLYAKLEEEDSNEGE